MTVLGRPSKLVSRVRSTEGEGNCANRLAAEVVVLLTWMVGPGEADEVNQRSGP